MPSPVDLPTPGPLDSVTLLSQARVGELLGGHRTTVWRLCQAGELAVVLVGCSPRVPLASLRAYVARQARKSSVTPIRERKEA